MTEIKKQPTVFFEANVESDGYSFLVIYGKHVNGGFCAIPNWEISCEMGDYDSTHYNCEKLLHAGVPESCVKDIAYAILEYGEEPYKQWKQNNLNQEEMENKVVINEENIELKPDDYKSKWKEVETIPCNNPSKIVVFDTETTGMSPDEDEILQFSAIDGDGNVLLDEYIKPSFHTEWPGAENVHHISAEMLDDKETMLEMAGKIRGVMESAEVLIAYNASYDLAFLNNNIGFTVREDQTVEDVMLDFAEFYGEINEKYGTYKWKKLTEASDYFDFDWNKYSAHNSLGDCNATLFVYKKLKEINDSSDPISNTVEQDSNGIEF